MYPNHICSLDHNNQFGIGKSRETINNNFFKSVSWFQISSKNPQTKLYFRSVTSITKEQQRQKLLKHSFAIHPFSLFRFYYECIFTVLQFLTLWYIPLHAMRAPINGKNPTIMGMPVILSDCMHMLDFALNFFTGYYNPLTRNFSLSPREIASLYARNHLFSYDLFISFPIYSLKRFIFGFWTPELGSLGFGLLRLCNLVYIFRLKQFLKYYNSSTEIIRSRIYLRFCIKCFLLSCLCIHWMTCIYCIVTTFRNTYTYHEDIHITRIKYETPNLTINNYRNMYSQALFIVVAYVLGVNISNMTAAYHRTTSFHIETIDQLIILFIYTIFGYIMCQIFLIVILQMMLSISYSETKYHSIIGELKSYAHLKNIPSTMKERMLTYYNYRFRERYFREESIKNLLSVPLCREIYLYSCRQLVDSIPILKEVPSEVLSEMINYLEHEIFLYNDIIYKSGASGDHMYFISSGTVCMLSPSGKEVTHLQDGNIFGMSVLTTANRRRVGSVVAIEICELYKLHKRNFNKCVPADSPLYQKIEETARERMEKILLMDELHKKYIARPTEARKTKTSDMF